MNENLSFKNPSLEEIFNRYKNKMYGLAVSITRNDADAQDVLQSAFTQIAKNLNRFRHKSRLSTWIYRITYNEALMLLRKRSRGYRLSKSLKFHARKQVSGLFFNWMQSPDKHLLDEEIKDYMDAALSRLPIQYRMPILLHIVEKLSLKESAEILGLKVNSLKTRVHRAALRLRSEINSYFKDRPLERTERNGLCGRMSGLIYGYSTGSLDQEKKDAFQKHIEDCKGCTDFLKTYQNAIRLTGSIECRDMPPELQERLKSFLLKIP